MTNDAVISTAREKSLETGIIENPQSHSHFCAGRGIISDCDLMKERLERLLNIRPGEWSDTLSFWVFNTLVWTGLSIGESVAETLFLKRVGVDLLPHMFILVSLAAIPLSFVYSTLQQRMGRVELSLALLGFAMVGLGVCIFVIHSGWQFAEIPIGFPLLYILQNTLATILGANFSILIAHQFTTLDSKRLVPLIFSGTIAGALCGGIILTLASERFGVVNLLLVWLALLVASLNWFVFFCRKRFSSPIGAEERENAPKYVVESWMDQIVCQTRAVFESPLLLLLAGSALFMTIGRFFIEYQYSEIFGNHFVQEAELARFFGQFTILSNVLALAFQSLVTGRMIQSLGVSNANLFYPISTFLAFLGTGVSYTLWPGVFARFNQEGFRRAVFQPVSNLFYNAIPSKRRSRSIAFNEGVVIPIGSVLAGTLLIGLQGRHILFSTVSLCICSLWAALTWGQREVYSKSLLDLLRRSLIERYTYEEKDLGTLDVKTQVLVIEAMNDPNDEVAELAADLLIKFGSPSARLALLRQANNARASLQKILLQKLSAFPSPDTKGFLLKCLGCGDVEIRLETLHALIRYPHDEEIRLRVGEFLESNDVRHRAAAAAAVIRGGDLVQMLKALLVLQKLIYSKNKNEIILGIESLGETCDERFWVNLRIYLSSPSPELRLAAMRSMNQMVQAGEVHEHLEILYRLLGDKVREIRSLAIQIIGRVHQPQNIPHLIDALSDHSPRNRALALEALSRYGGEILSDLLMVLDDPRATVHGQLGAVRLLSMSQDPQIREKLASFGFQKVRAIYEAKIDEMVVNEELPADLSKYLSMVLSEKSQAMMKIVLALVAPEQNQAARTLFKSLYSRNQEMMSNAIEILQGMGERTLIYHLLPVLEGLPIKQIVAYGVRVFSLPQPTARQVIGRYLLALDNDLKEAAIFTVGSLGMTELSETIKKIQQNESASSSLAEICFWSLDQLSKAGLFSSVANASMQK